MEAKKTPLYAAHEKCGGKIVEFAGWMLPVQYSGILAEHQAVRTQAGLFDVSHMGEVFYEGPRALESLNALLTNDFTSMKPGGVRYSVMCYPNGTAVDDVLVYKIADDRYMVVVNAANCDKDYQWMTAQDKTGTAITNRSDDYAQLALQGPLAQQILEKLTKDDLPRRNYSFTFATVDGEPAIVSRTGYTGEDGFEIYVDPQAAEKLWFDLLEAGKPLGLIPCGLGARDTLRFEAAMPLYGHELSDAITPLEADLDHFVRLDKPDFTGRDALLQQKEVGVKRLRCGIELTVRGIAREGADVYSGEKLIGKTTTGTHAPTLGKSLAMALLDVPFTRPGTPVQVEVRGKKLDAVVVGLPFYKRSAQ